MPFEPVPTKNLVERLVSGSLWLLVAAIALVMTVELLRSVWVWLIVMTVATFGVVGLINWWRWRLRGW